MMADSFGEHWFRRTQAGARRAGGRRPTRRERRTTLTVEALERREVPVVGFTAGDLAVLDLAAPVSTNTTASVLELSPSVANQAAPVFSVSISAAGAGAMRFSNSGTSSYLSDTNDGSLLAFGAYNTTTTSGNLATLTGNVRAVGTLDTNTNFVLQATYSEPTADSGNQTRSATSVDNSAWYFTDKSGLFTNGATAPSLGTNILNARSFGGTVYVSSTQASPVVAVSTVSSPTATSLTGLPGIASDSKIQDFYLIQSGSNGDTYDVLYTVDQGTSSATVNKFSLVSGSWVANGTYTFASNAESMIAENNGSGGAYLFVLTGSGSVNNSVVRLTDAAGYNATINVSTPSNVTLYTDTASDLLKGIAFAPQSATATTTAISSITPLTASLGQSVSFTATVMANTGGTAPTGGVVEFFNGGPSGTLLATAPAVSSTGATTTFSVSTTAIPAASYSNIQAFYLGNSGFAASHSGTFGSTLTVNAIGTTTAITSITPLVSNVGTSISFTATVTGATSAAPGAGSVAFYNGGTGGTLLATATSETTAANVATFTVSTSAVPAGNYNNIQAFYTPSTGFAASNSGVYGSTLQVNQPGIIAAWTFPAIVAAPDNSPAPTVGNPSATATTLGMTNTLTNGNGTGNTASDDVLTTSGTADTSFTENTWRIRGTPNNGWAQSAPQYSQGIELDTSTVGYSNIVFAFDWYSTTQGVRDLQVQYNTGSGWVNYQGPSPTGTFVATSNDYYNSGLSPVNPTITINLTNVPGAANNPDLGIRLVSAYDSTGTLEASSPSTPYASAASTPGNIVPYNNTSGNWRFGNLIFYGNLTTTTTTLSASPAGSQNFGKNVVFTATVTPASGTQFPTGTINFYDGSNLIGSRPVVQVGTTNVGTAALTTSTLSAGIHGDVTAQYVPTTGNGFIASGSGMNLTVGDPTDNPISYVINAPQATGVDVSPVAGRSFTGVVATFSDGLLTNAAGFSASINWGDNTSATVGQVAFSSSVNETNILGQIVDVRVFTVTGTHTYAAAGNYPISVTITDPGGNSSTVNPNARVAYAPLVVSPVAGLSAPAGLSLSGATVATFTDPGLVANLSALGISNPAAQFSASVTWGDNTPATTGTVTYNPSTQVFGVAGSHSYAQPGAYSISVAVTPLTVSVSRVDSSDPNALNLVGDENGNGITDSPSEAFIDQFVMGSANQAGSLYTFSLPTVQTTSGNAALTTASYSKHEGALNLSTNGQYLVIGGYNLTVNAWGPQATFSPASVVNRVIGTISGAGVINTTTALTDAYSGDNFRDVVSTNGTQFWTAGNATDSTNGLHYATLGATTSMIVSGLANGNDVAIFNGQLYAGIRQAQSSQPAGIYQIGTGLPATGGQTPTLFFQVPQTNPLDGTDGGKSTSPSGLFMAALNDGNPTINGVNVAYVADDEMGIARYDYTNTGWQFSYYINSTGAFLNSAYTVDGSGNVTPAGGFNASNPAASADSTKAGGVRELTGRVVNGQVQLFAVTGFGTGAEPTPTGGTAGSAGGFADRVIALTDTGAGSGFTVLATNSGASVYAGIAFTPTQTVSDSLVSLVKSTNRVGVAQGGPTYNRVTKTSALSLTISNTSGAALDGPFSVVLGSLTSGVTLLSAGVTVNGRAVALAVTSDGAGHLVINVPTSVAASLAPGRSLPAIALVFANPSAERFGFTTDFFNNPL